MDNRFNIDSALRDYDKYKEHLIDKEYEGIDDSEDDELEDDEEEIDDDEPAVINDKSGVLEEKSE